MRWGAHTKCDFFGKKKPYHKETILQAILIRDKTLASLPPSSLLKPTDSSYNASLWFGGDKDDCSVLEKYWNVHRHGFQFLTLLSTFGEETLT